MRALNLWRKMAVACVLAGLSLPAMGAGPDKAALRQARQKGAEFLKVSQGAEGGWSSPQEPGIAAICTTALLATGATVDDPAVAKAFQHLETYVRADGGIYAENSRHKNYETSIALMAFQAANQDGRYKQTIERAVAYLRGLQWDESNNTPENDVKYGGAGYGSSQRPDLSNTAFFIDALRGAGVAADDPAIQKALVFVSRCQNRESAYNTTEFAAKINDGGFYYTPAAGGSSLAGKTDEGGLRSYASMTYAGLKSMIHAGLKADDPRVKAATDWIRQHYTVAENPGMGAMGLYYYLHTFAKALSVMGVDEFVDAGGARHDWRKELADHLFSLQQPNGSWVNSADRFMEGDPNLVTAFALLALQYCEPK